MYALFEDGGKFLQAQQAGVQRVDETFHGIGEIGASALTATKPSPPRKLAMRTTSLVARATAASSSPTMSPISTILGRPCLFALVA